MHAGEAFEIGRILHLKSEIRDFELDSGLRTVSVQFKFSDFGFEMQDSSNFKCRHAAELSQVCYSPFQGGESCAPALTLLRCAVGGDFDVAVLGFPD